MEYRLIWLRVQKKNRETTEDVEEKIAKKIMREAKAQQREIEEEEQQECVVVNGLACVSLHAFVHARDMNVIITTTTHTSSSRTRACHSYGAFFVPLCITLLLVAWCLSSLTE